MRLYSSKPIASGLSPRGRGKPLHQRRRRLVQRSIPAWAGETRATRYCRSSKPVYPRVGGGNFTIAPYSPASAGLSPRGRGKLEQPRSVAHISGSIPAWAGETSSARRPARPAGVYPRVGGGNPGRVRPPTQQMGLSPRGRGKRRPR